MLLLKPILQHLIIIRVVAPQRGYGTWREIITCTVTTPSRGGHVAVTPLKKGMNMVINHLKKAHVTALKKGLGMESGTCTVTPLKEVHIIVTALNGLRITLPTLKKK